MSYWTTRASTRGGHSSRKRRRAASPCFVEHLESRTLLSVGGGFTRGGLLGQYYPNLTLSGAPAFARQDVRVDFDWGNYPVVGGSTSPGFNAVGPNNFSVRWTGQVVSNFSEKYTFTTRSDDGVRLLIRPTGASTWTVLVDDWNSHPLTVDNGAYSLVAGQSYDVELDYRQNGGGAAIQLAWSSPSAPSEVIDPLSVAGINAGTYVNQVYADAMKGARDEWGDPNNYFSAPLVPADANGWPLGDATKVVWEGRDASSMTGTYLLQFQGKATLSTGFNLGQFSAGGQSYGASLPSGAGYDAATNTTTATIQIPQSDLASIFYLTFKNTQRTASSPLDSGITNVSLMRPTAPGASTYYAPGTLFDANVEAAFANYTTERWLTANFNTTEVNWTDRALPGYAIAAYSANKAVWEYLVMLANETGKDLYITIPVNASPDYVTKLAELIRYGSDGVNPYTAPQAHPVYPGLNPNLRVYVEWSNEVWNAAFSQSSAAATAARQAVQSGTPDGAIINYDGNAPNGDFRRWVALRTVQTSNTFRAVFGDAAMNNRVRMVLEFQYNNWQDTASTALGFINDYFNNGDGQVHVANPHPVNYYLWGAGAAAYYTSGNPTGAQSTVVFANAGFESSSSPISPGTASADPTGASWSFTGDAGIYRDALQTAGAQGFGPDAPEGSQAAYIGGTGTMTQTVYFPNTGTFALQMTAASKDGAPNAVRVFVDGVEITPYLNDYRPTSTPWTPGSGTWGLDWRKYNVVGTAPFTISSPGLHTIKIIGTGAPGTYTYFDAMQVTSLDAIFAGGLPGIGDPGTDANTARANYQTQLNTGADFALAYGLQVVAYEGGWGLGGDSGGTPLQNYAKYKDPRAKQATLDSITAFQQSGGALYLFGTYDQWPRDDSVHAADYPILQATAAAADTRPATPTNALNDFRSLTLANRMLASNLALTNQGGTLTTGGWLTWNILVTQPGTYTFMLTTGTGGAVRLSVDDSTGVFTAPSGSQVAGTSTLSRGLHTLKVQMLSGSAKFTELKVTYTPPPVRVPDAVPDQPVEVPVPQPQQPSSPPSGGSPNPAPVTPTAPAARQTAPVPPPSTVVPLVPSVAKTVGGARLRQHRTRQPVTARKTATAGRHPSRPPVRKIVHTRTTPLRPVRAVRNLRHRP